MYDPTKVGTGTKYSTNWLYEYGNVVTYSWNASGNYLHYVGANGVTGDLTGLHSSEYYWYNIETNAFVQIQFTASGAITALTSNYYMYFFATLSAASGTTENGILPARA